MPDRFALYPQQDTFIEALGGVVDGYPITAHKGRVSKTTIPIETGGTITDHAVREPHELELTGLVSDLRFLRGHERPARAWEKIADLMKRREQLTVITAWGVYNNMLIVQIDAHAAAQTGRGMRFAMKLEEVIQAGSQTPGLQNAALTGPAAGRGAATENGFKQLDLATLASVDDSLLEIRDAMNGNDSRRLSNNGFNALRALLGVANSSVRLAQNAPITARAAALIDLARNVAELGDLTLAQRIPLANDPSENFRFAMQNRQAQISTWKAAGERFVDLADLTRGLVTQGERLQSGSYLLEGRPNDLAGRIGAIDNLAGDLQLIYSHGLV